ncbi:MAG: NAD-dependent alcohol dehydrogenase, partial [Halolamina sp.]
AHQGTVHGVLAPHVLRYVFSAIDGRRRLLAEALGVAGPEMTDDALGDAVVDAVSGVRDDLGLPSRLRAIGGLDRGHLPEIAGTIHDDSLFAEAPVRPSVAEIEQVLESSW